MIAYQYVAEILFYGFILLVFFGALLAVRAKLLMHAILGLAVCLLGVAGLYFYLGSMFVCLMQLLIYIGAICVVLAFGIMVGYTPTEVSLKYQVVTNRFLAAAAAAAAFFLLVFALGRTIFIPAAEKTGDFSVAYLGENLLYRYCLAFELISVVLLIAIVGSTILGRGGRTRDLRKYYVLKQEEKEGVGS